MKKRRKRKSAINIVAGVLDIILSLLALSSIPAILGEAFSEDGNASAMATFIIIAMVIGIIIHVIGLIINKKLGISIVGHILGIVGCSIYAVFGALMFIATLVLLILACIFTFMQKNIQQE